MEKFFASIESLEIKNVILQEQLSGLQNELNALLDKLREADSIEERVVKSRPILIKSIHFVFDVI